MATNGYAKIELFDLQPQNGLYIRDISISGSAFPNDSVDCELRYTGSSLCQPPVVAFVGQELLPETDFGVVRYLWNSLYGGADLDTKTALLIPGISGQNVGWSEQPDAYHITGTDGAILATWGGDNTTSVNGESVLIDFKQIKLSYPDLTGLNVQLGARWFGQPTSGNITVEFASYLGGAMEQYQLSGSSAFDWRPVSGGKLVQITDLPYHITSTQYTPGFPVADDCGQFHYSFNNKAGYFSYGPGLLSPSGYSQTNTYDPNYTQIPTTLSYYENGQLIRSNGDWTQSADYQTIFDSPYGPLSSGSAAIYSNASYNVSRIFKAAPSSQNGLPTKLKLNVCQVYSTGQDIYGVTGQIYVGDTLPDNLESGYIEIFSNTASWLDYDMQSGFDPKMKQIVAYSVSLLDSIAGNNYLPLNSGQSSPSIVLPWGKSVAGNICNTFTLTEISGQCDSGDHSLTYCVTGNYLTQDDIDKEVKIALGLITGGTATSDSSTISSGDLNSQYYYYTGGMIYNLPSMGDSVTFNSYALPQGYSGNFTDIYGYDPTYPEISKTWTWGVDYNSIDDLVNVINNDLYYNTYQLWINSACQGRDLIPIFENGPLLEATKGGDNLIKFSSQRPGEAGLYSLVVNSTTVPIASGTTTKKYLTPSVVYLEGRNNPTDSWSVVDYHSGIDWNAADHRLISGYYNRFQTTDPRSVVAKSGDKEPNPTGASGNFLIDVLGTMTVTGRNDCGTKSSVDITFYKAPFSGSCTPPDDDDDPKNPPSGGHDPYDDLNGNLGNPMVLGSVLKTGWKFLNSNSYNFYRLNFSGFNGTAPLLQGAPSLEFYATNVDYYSLDSNRDEFYGSTCLEGSAYTADIFGTASGRLTGIATGQITEDDSGIYTWKNVEIRHEPVPGSVKFSSRSATTYGILTGHLNASTVGIGVMSSEVQGYYYDDPTNNVVSFSKTISGLISGCGQISGGPYNVIDGAAWSGATASSSQYVVKQVTLPVSGIAPHYPYFATDFDCFGYLQGTLNGYVSGTGSYTFDQSIQGVPTNVYQTVADSYVNASAFVSIDHPLSGDSLYLNGVKIAYSTKSGAGAPSFFSSRDTLLSIVNNNPTSFQMSGNADNGSGINLYSLISGESGNNLTISTSSSGISFTSFQGGVSNYLEMQPTNIYSGQIFQTVQAVQSFNNLPVSGYISGYANKATQIRNFSDLWNLRTGNLNYGTTGWYDYMSFKKPSGLPVGLFSSPGQLNLNVSYFGAAPTSSPDVAKLRISGINFNEVLEFNITGYQ